MLGRTSHHTPHTSYSIFRVTINIETGLAWFALLVTGVTMMWALTMGKLTTLRDMGRCLSPLAGSNGHSDV